MTDLRTIKRHSDFVEKLALYAKLRGHDDARPRTARTRLADAWDPATEQGDLLGIRDTAVRVAASQDPRPSDLLAHAERDAELNNKKFAVAILDRPNRAVDESYCVMSYSSYLDLIARVEQLEAETAQ